MNDATEITVTPDGASKPPFPPVDPITADSIRSYLIERATAYSQRSGDSFSLISREAVKDDRFLARARAGANFTIETYQRVIAWIDAREAVLNQT